MIILVEHTHTTRTHTPKNAEKCFVSMASHEFGYVWYAWCETAQSRNVCRGEVARARDLLWHRRCRGVKAPAFIHRLRGPRTRARLVRISLRRQQFLWRVGFVRVRMRKLQEGCARTDAR